MWSRVEKISLEIDAVRYFKAADLNSDLKETHNVKVSFEDANEAHPFVVLAAQNLYELRAAAKSVEQKHQRLVRKAYRLPNFSEISVINGEVFEDRFIKHQILAGWLFHAKSERVYVCADSKEQALKAFDVITDIDKEYSKGEK